MESRGVRFSSSTEGEYDKLKKFKTASDVKWYIVKLLIITMNDVALASFSI